MEPTKSLNCEIISAEGSYLDFFSGKEKIRLRLSQLDETNRYAIALKDNQLFDTVDSMGWLKNKKWIPIKITANSGDKYVKAEISSIKARLDLSVEDIHNLYYNNGLEANLQRTINNYEAVVNKVKCCFATLENVSRALEMGVKEAGRVWIKALDSQTIDNPEIKECVQRLLPKLNAIINNKKIDNAKLKSSFIRRLGGFTCQLSFRLENFAQPVLPREKMISSISTWKDQTSPFKDKIELRQVHLPQNRLSRMYWRFYLVDPQHEVAGHLAVRTDGYFYRQKPRADDGFVPYSDDGQNWIRLHVVSLGGLSGLDEKEIIRAAATKDNGEALRSLIKGQRLNEKTDAHYDIVPDNLGRGARHGGDLPDNEIGRDALDEIYKRGNFRPLWKKIFQFQ